MTFDVACRPPAVQAGVYTEFWCRRDGVMVRDACYTKVLAQYGGKWSARAAQSVAKCRKAHGNVRKTAAGTSLKRWAKEKWVNAKTGRPCGNEKDRTEYCRPTKRVSAATPSKGSKAARAANYRRKLAGKKARRV